MNTVFFRVKRNDQFENVPLEEMTEAEQALALWDRDAQYLLSCIGYLSEKARDLHAFLESEGYELASSDETSL